MKPHPDKAELDALFPAVRAYQKLAAKHGIKDIFQDNGGKLLQVILTLDLTVIPGRAGNDAKDAAGREYELKSVNIELQRSITTNHHLTHELIAKYRGADWIVAIYKNIELAAIFKLPPQSLEPWFSKWEQKLRDGLRGHLNNPKIPLSFVSRHGERIFGDENWEFDI